MQLSTNTRAFVEAEQYSRFILLNLHDGLLPSVWYRNVSDFGSGDTLNIKTIGSVTLQDAAEDEPLVYNPIETGEITLTITEYKGDAWYVTDDLREDGTDIDRLMAERASESTRAYQEVVETDFLAKAAEIYIAATDGKNVNGQPHFIASAEVNDVFSTNHLIQMKLSFDKANVPDAGRVFICDPLVEATLNKNFTLTHDVTPFGERLIQAGMARGMRFVMNLFGWDIVTSNRLAVGDANDGSTTITNAVFNICMCVLDDQTKPVMHAVRRQPKVEGERNKDFARDEFVMRARYGFGLQRVDTLGAIATSSTAFE